MRRNRPVIWLFIALLSGLETNCLFAEEGSGDVEAAALLKRTGTFYSHLKNMSVKLTLTIQLQKDDVKSELVSKYEVHIERPNKIAFIVKEGLGANVVCDGKKMSVEVPALKIHTEQEAPATLEGFFAVDEKADQRSKEQSQILSLGTLMYSVLIEGVQQARTVGTETINGTKCTHLSSTATAGSCELWIELGERPLVRKVTAEISKLMKTSDTASFKAVAVLVCSSWEMDGRVAEGVFWTGK